MMLYFAYGSNMCEDQMVERCPSARFVGIATLRDYKLAFTRRSKTRRCGVADAIESPGQVLWGVVYELRDSDIDSLDQSEGYRPGRQVGNSYWRLESHVYLHNDERERCRVWTYFAERQADPPKPNRAYADLIVGGARRWGLPPDYIAVLRQIAVDP
jgi:gamma-glutamylcyclotransferase (GGCT)/AIG2-like uncharacterized protein YtfP